MSKSLFKTDKKQKYIAIIITAIYFLVHLFVLGKHEPWRDEAQAWVIAKNLNLIEIFKLLRTEGHPFLWFVFIMPFAKLGLSFYYVNYISLLVMSLCVFLFVLYSPFHLLINIIVLLSTSFLYFNPIIFRLYCLPILILILICTTYKKRYDKPLLYVVLLSLLFQTHIKYSGFAIGLSLEFVYSLLINKKLKEYNKYLLLPLFSLLFLIVELIPIGSYEPYSAFDSKVVFSNFWQLLIGGIERIGLSSFGISNAVVSYILFIVFISLFIYQIIICLKDKNYNNYLGLLFAGFCGFGGYYLITSFVHGSHHQMSSILCMVFISSSWLLQYIENLKIKQLSKIMVILYCALTIPTNIANMFDDVNRVYSCGKMTGEYIINNIEENSVILLPYSDRNPLVYSIVESKRDDIFFYDMNNEIEFTYHKWRQPYYEHVGSEIVEIAHKYFEGKNVYYLSKQELTGDDMKLVYSNQDIDTIEHENYCLYEVFK